MGRDAGLGVIERLAPQPGETVLDVGCGTGLGFADIRERIGPEGQLVGVELSQAMAERARERIRARGWDNVQVIEGPAQSVAIPGYADAAVFVLAHDIVRTAAALDNVLGNVRAHGRVVLTGAKWAPPWLVPLNIYVWLKGRRYVTTFEGFSSPWSLLEARLEDFEVESAFAGGAYVATGRLSLE